MNFLRSLFARHGGTAPSPDEASTILQRQLARPASSYDLSRLIPVLVPRTFSETAVWPGPIYQLTSPQFDQTWAVLGDGDSLVYVSRAIQASWEDGGKDWKQIAADNLRAIAEAEPYSHARERGDRSVIMTMMLYGQNLAGARLLVPHLYDAIFPDGYAVAVPEMTCTVAISHRANAEERQAADELISNLFREGAEPVSTAMIDPRSLWSFASEDLGLPA